MDIVKEIYDVLTNHLGKEHRGKKQLGPEFGELKNDLNRLVAYAVSYGKCLGAEQIKLELAREYGFITEIHDRAYVELRKERASAQKQYQGETDVTE